MKTLCTLLTVTVLFFPFKSKAQNNPEGGFVLLDSVSKKYNLITELSCYNFLLLSATVPNDEKVKKYIKFKQTLSITPELGLKESVFAPGEYGLIPVSATVTRTQTENDAPGVGFNYIAGQITFPLFLKGNNLPMISFYPSCNDITQYGDRVLISLTKMKYPCRQKDFDSSKKQKLVWSLFGGYESGQVKEYDESCNCYKMYPTYSYEILYTYELPLLNQEGYPKSRPKMVTESGTCEQKSTALKSENSNTPDSPTVTNNTGNTSIPTKTNDLTTSALNARSLKPLDKTKPGYQTQKNDAGKITWEGYKKGDKLNGEVRTYDDQGRLNYIYTWVNDEKSGYYAEYDPETGNIITSGNYKGNEKDGEWKRYKNGKQVGTDTYLDGEKQ